MKNKTLFLTTIFSLFLIIMGLTSCGGSSRERQPTDACSTYKSNIEILDNEIASLRLEIQNLKAEKEKNNCPDQELHSIGLKVFNGAGTDKNIPYKVLYIDNIPVYDSDDSGKETKIGIHTTALIRSEDKHASDIYISQLYEDDENGNDAPKVKAGDVVWIQDVNLGEGTTETTLIKK